MPCLTPIPHKECPSSSKNTGSLALVQQPFAGGPAAIDFDRCVKLINEKVVENGNKPLPDRVIKGLCAKLHHEATGAWPGHAPGEQAEKAAKGH